MLATETSTGATGMIVILARNIRRSLTNIRPKILRLIRPSPTIHPSIPVMAAVAITMEMPETREVPAIQAHLITTLTTAPDRHPPALAAVQVHRPVPIHLQGRRAQGRRARILRGPALQAPVRVRHRHPV